MRRIRAALADSGSATFQPVPGRSRLKKRFPWTHTHERLCSGRRGAARAGKVDGIRGDDGVYQGV